VLVYFINYISQDTNRTLDAGYFVMPASMINGSSLACVGIKFHGIYDCTKSGGNTARFNMGNLVYAEVFAIT
jgi:hypothetical protein